MDSQSILNDCIDVDIQQITAKEFSLDSTNIKGLLYFDRENNAPGQRSADCVYEMIVVCLFDNNLFIFESEKLNGRMDSSHVGEKLMSESDLNLYKRLSVSTLEPCINVKATEIRDNLEGTSNSQLRGSFVNVVTKVYPFQLQDKASGKVYYFAAESDHVRTLWTLVINAVLDIGGDMKNAVTSPHLLAPLPTLFPPGDDASSSRRDDQETDYSRALQVPTCHMQHNGRTKKEKEKGKEGELDKDKVRLWTGTWNVGGVCPILQMAPGDHDSAYDDFITDSESSRKVIETLLESTDVNIENFDIFVLALQEAPERELLTKAFGRWTNTSRVLLKSTPSNELCYSNEKIGNSNKMDRIRGYGDHALLSTKSTMICVYTKASILPKLKVISVVNHALSATSSKGGVAVALKVFNTTLCFLSCHLAAAANSNKSDKRNKQVKILSSEVGSKICGWATGWPLETQFHHTIWMGDLNYRLEDTTPKAALEAIAEVDGTWEGSTALRKLHYEHDSLLKAVTNENIFSGYYEPIKMQDFLPSYKKVENRGSNGHHFQKKGWEKEVYRTEYKEPFYKGGRIKTRIPGWCDRILVHSYRHLNHLLVPDTLAVRVTKRSSQNKGINISSGDQKEEKENLEEYIIAHSYRSVLDGYGMDISDHSAVSCSFTLHLEHRRKGTGAVYRRRDISEDVPRHSLFLSSGKKVTLHRAEERGRENGTLKKKKKKNDSYTLRSVLGYLSQASGGNSDTDHKSDEEGENMEHIDLPEYVKRADSNTRPSRGSTGSLISLASLVTGRFSSSQGKQRGGTRKIIIMATIKDILIYQPSRGQRRRIPKSPMRVEILHPAPFESDDCSNSHLWMSAAPAGNEYKISECNFKFECILSEEDGSMEDHQIAATSSSAAVSTSDEAEHVLMKFNLQNKVDAFCYVSIESRQDIARYMMQQSNNTRSSSGSNIVKRLSMFRSSEFRKDLLIEKYDAIPLVLAGNVQTRKQIFSSFSIAFSRVTMEKREVKVIGTMHLGDDDIESESEDESIDGVVHQQDQDDSDEEREVFTSNVSAGSTVKEASVPVVTKSTNTASLNVQINNVNENPISYDPNDHSTHEDHSSANTFVEDEDFDFDLSSSATTGPATSLPVTHTKNEIPQTTTSNKPSVERIIEEMRREAAKDLVSDAGGDVLGENGKDSEAAEFLQNKKDGGTDLVALSSMSLNDMFGNKGCIDVTSSDGDAGSLAHLLSSSKEDEKFDISSIAITKPTEASSQTKTKEELQERAAIEAKLKLGAGVGPLDILSEGNEEDEDEEEEEEQATDGNNNTVTQEQDTQNLGLANDEQKGPMNVWDAIDAALIRAENEKQKKKPNGMTNLDASKLEPLSFHEYVAYFKSINEGESKTDTLQQQQQEKEKTAQHTNSLLCCFSGSTNMNKPSVYCDPTIDLMRKTSLQVEIPIHNRVMRTIWTHLTGKKTLLGLTGSHWEDIGFQGTNPGTDLRACGCFALVQTLAFCEANSTLTKRMMLWNKGKNEFPIMLVFINFSLSCLHLLSSHTEFFTGGGDPTKFSSKTDAILSQMNTLHEAFIIRFYIHWVRHSCSVMSGDFEQVKSLLFTKAKKSLKTFVKEAKKGLKNLDDTPVNKSLIVKATSPKPLPSDSDKTEELKFSAF
eukprot:g2482.t1